jgi:hypothetical protein
MPSRGFTGWSVDEGSGVPIVVPFAKIPIRSYTSTGVSCRATRPPTTALMRGRSAVHISDRLKGSLQQVAPAV